MPTDLLPSSGYCTLDCSHNCYFAMSLHVTIPNSVLAIAIIAFALSLPRETNSSSVRVLGMPPLHIWQCCMERLLLLSWQDGLW
jgi:hypothetical protein